MRKVNYHTHTMRCKHAWGSEEEYIKNAIQAGFDVLGFADHCPYTYQSHMRMDLAEMESYVQTLQALKEKYKDQIHLMIGLECEYFPEHIDFLKQLIKQYDLDYIILGHHFYKSESNHYFGRVTYDENHLKAYVNQAILAFQTGLYSYLAHPDLIDFRPSHSEIYHREMRRLCEACKAYEIPLEFNLLGYKNNRCYPNMKDFWPIASSVGNQVIIGFDAHQPSDLLNTESYQMAIDYLKGLNLEIKDTIPLRF